MLAVTDSDSIMDWPAVYLGIIARSGRMAP
jgi:hypothetical protein